MISARGATVVAGAVAGVASAVLVSWLSAGPATEAPAEVPRGGVVTPGPPPTGRPIDRPSNSDDRNELARGQLLEGEVYAVDEARETASAAHDGSAEGEHEALVEDSLAEPIDSRWASQAASSLEQDLVDLARGAFDVVSVQCRTTSCVANIEWTTFTEATQNYNRLVTYDYEVNCTRTIRLPEPEDPQVPYQANLVIHGCTRE